jgi:hypothetical protein
MKIIFLDNDGVICLDNNWGGRTRKWNEWIKKHPESLSYKDCDVFHRFDNFDKKAVNVLNQILEETGAEIVVSSDWKKHASLNELGDYYISQGISKRPIAITPIFIGCDKHDGFEWSYCDQYEQQRCLEIMQYVKDNPSITHWVAVDDLVMQREVTNKHNGDQSRVWGLDNFVWTPKMSEGIKQTGIKQKILNLLS